MLEYFWMEVKEINTGQLKQKREIYDKDISGFWNQKKKNPSDHIFLFQISRTEYFIDPEWPGGLYLITCS